MEIFHVGDKVFLLDDRSDIRPHKYGKIIAIYAKNNIMVISLIDKANTSICVHIDSPHIHKINFFPKDHVIIHDLLKDYCNKRGVVDAYSWQIDRYRVMINNEPHWFAPFELSLEDYVDKKDENTDGFIASFSCFSPIKVRLSDEGKKAFEYHFGVKPIVDAKGRTGFRNLAQLMEMFDPTFIYGDKYMKGLTEKLEDDEIFVKVMN